MERSQKDVIEIINKVEAEFPVHTITYKGISVWPLVRLFFTSQLFNDPRPLHYKLPEFSVTGTRHTIKKRKALYEKVRDEVAVVNWENNAKQFNKHYPIVMLSESSRRTEEINGYKYHRLLDSIADHVDNKEDVLTIEYSDNGERIKPAYLQPQYIDDLFRKAEYEEEKRHYKKRLLGGKVLQRVKNYDQFTTYLTKNEIPFQCTEAYMAYRMEEVLRYKGVFLEIIKKTTPKALFLVCFYSAISMGAVLACNQMGVSAVELQHGQQGDFHLMHTHWVHFPPDGYELLPTHFWTWGDLSYQRINKWCSASKRHHVLNAGNAWVSLWKNNRIRQFTTGNIEIEEKRKVLFSLQPIDDPIPSYVLEAMQQTNELLIWAVRLHPQMLNRRQEIIDILVKAGCKNVNIDDATSLPLYPLFNMVDVHVTLWSTTAYEALAFGVHSVIAHPIGYDAMQEYCDEGIFAFADTSAAIIKALDADYRYASEKKKYMLVDETLIRQYISQLIDNESRPGNTVRIQSP